MTVATLVDLEQVRAAVGAVPDPEVPVLSIADLGVLRSVSVEESADGPVVVVTVTPTYSGCPAMDVIRDRVAQEVRRLGHRVEVRTVLSPAWTTDWMTADARERLRQWGIAPPEPGAGVRAGARPGGPVAVTIGRRPTSQPACPRCGSVATQEVAHFGSTACKSLWRCTSCLEPFDHFKEL